MINSEHGLKPSVQDKKRLLVLTSSYPFDKSDGRAAAGFFVKDFITLISSLSEVTVITQNIEKETSISQEDKVSVIRFPWSGKSRPLSTLRLPQDFFLILSVIFSGISASIKHIRKNKTDHIIAMWAIPSGVWALFMKYFFNIPYTVWCLGSDVWNYQNSYFPRAILRLILKNANTVYADGFELRDTIKRIACINCTYLPSSRNFKKPIKHLSLKPEGVRHYLFVGRFHPNKGPDILIKAIHLLPKEIRSNIHCHMFGGGPLTNELKLLIKEFQLESSITLGDFIGEEKLIELLDAADVIVIPSRKDTISLMVSAALQINKSIIATDVGDMGYVLKKYLAGRTVPAESAEAFAQAIEQDLLSSNEYAHGRSELLELIDLSKSVATMLEDISLKNKK